MAKTVVGFFDTYEQARDAYDELARQSVDRHQMSLITAGGMVALVDIGVPEEEARLYQEGVRRGGTLLIVHSPDSKAAKRAAAIMNNFGAQDIERRSADWQSSSDQKLAPSGDVQAAPAQPGEERIEDRPRRDEIRIPIGGPDSDDQDVPISTVAPEDMTIRERPANPGEASRIQDRPDSSAPMRADQGVQ